MDIDFFMCLCFDVLGQDFSWSLASMGLVGFGSRKH